jgi:hypothetical protein
MRSGQSLKEITVNEALLAADILLHMAVEGVTATVPPTPSVGQCWLIGSGATGAFAGKTNQIAAWSEGGWRFVVPRAGMRAFYVSESAQRLYSSGSWHLVAAPASPAGGSVIDTQARTAISQIIAALVTAGIIS